MSEVPARVFLSLRFGEAMDEAIAIKTALQRLGTATFLCDVAPGGDIAEAVIPAIDAAELVVILGTETYGEKTASPFSTYEELKFIMDESKPFFLVKMCERFQYPQARFWLSSSVSYYQWTPSRGEKKYVPADLIDAIVKRLHALQGDQHAAKPAGSKAEKRNPPNPTGSKLATPQVSSADKRLRVPGPQQVRSTVSPSKSPTPRVLTPASSSLAPSRTARSPVPPSTPKQSPSKSPLSGLNRLLPTVFRATSPAIGKPTSPKPVSPRPLPTHTSATKSVPSKAISSSSRTAPLGKPSPLKPAKTVTPARAQPKNGITRAKATAAKPTQSVFTRLLPSAFKTTNSLTSSSSATPSTPRSRVHLQAKPTPSKHKPGKANGSNVASKPSPRAAKRPPAQRGGLTPSPRVKRK
eukprot:m.263584 g.263584  ORF g.263584 m.263584 type:complete len:410 (-) comp53819_c0_seq1:344-1573(-)